MLNIPDSRLIIVPNFPGSYGWYMPHAETGVPHGRQVDKSSDARYLCRLNASHVGFLVRNDCSYDYQRSVSAYNSASVPLGVVVEVPEGDVAKIEALLNPVEAPKRVVPKNAVITVSGISVGELKDLVTRAQGAVNNLPATLDAAVWDPIVQLVQAVANASLK